jgi:hypothetical protein
VRLLGKELQPVLQCRLPEPPYRPTPPPPIFLASRIPALAPSLHFSAGVPNPSLHLLSDAGGWGRSNTSRERGPVSPLPLPNMTPSGGQSVITSYVLSSNVSLALSVHTSPSSPSGHSPQIES